MTCTRGDYTTPYPNIAQRQILTSRHHETGYVPSCQHIWLSESDATDQTSSRKFARNFRWNIAVAKQRQTICSAHVLDYPLSLAESLYYLLSDSRALGGPWVLSPVVRGELQLHLFSGSWKNLLLLYSKWGKSWSRTDERTGKADNINSIHCLCPVIREEERTADRVGLELKTVMGELTTELSP